MICNKLAAYPCYRKTKCGSLFTNSEPRPGTCPAVEGSFGTCVEECQHDIDCTGEGQKCCSNGCGHVCVDAVPGMYLYHL